MVKAVVWILMAVGLLGSIFFTIQMMNADGGRLIGMAVTEADETGNCTVQVLVPALLAAEDPPLPGANFKPDWKTWLATHYDLRDDAGNKLDFRRGAYETKEIPVNKVGAAEFIAFATVKAGTKCEFNITPVVGEPEKYLLTFEATETPFERKRFLPNY